MWANAGPGRVAGATADVDHTRRAGRHPPLHQQGPQRPPRRRTGAGGRRGGPDRQHRDETGRHRTAEPRAPRGAGAGLRRPRARHGRDPQRLEPARRHHPHRRHVLRVQRLHAGGGAPGRHLRSQGHLLLDARLGRARRGRPDPPADRATGRHAGHARAAGDPPRRRQRVRPGPARRHRTRRAHRPDPEPAGHPGARGHGRPGAPTWRRARTPLLDGSEDPDVVLIGTGSEVSVCVAAAGLLAGRGGDGAGGVDAQLGAVRRAGRRLPGRGARARARRSSRSRPPPPSGGPGGPTTRSPSTTSGPRRRAPRSWPSSDSPRRTWPTGPGPCWRRWTPSTTTRQRRHEE